MLLKWENGAKRKDPISQTKLAKYYFTSFPELSKWWYRRASDHHYPDALFGRGFCYEYGYAVDDSNLKEAVRLYKEAAEGGNSDALNTLGALLRQADPQLAMELFSEGALRGNLDSMCNLALCFLHVEDLALPATQAVRLLRCGAEYNHAPSMHHLGNCCALGLGTVKPQLKEASHYWALAADRGCRDSAFNLGKCFYEGISRPKNYEFAYKWFSKAAENNHPFALYYKGLCYHEGKGVEKDNRIARELFDKSISQSHLLPEDLLEFLVKRVEESKQ